MCENPTQPTVAPLCGGTDKLATLRKKFPTLATQVRKTMKKYQGITAEDIDDDILTST